MTYLWLIPAVTASALGGLAFTIFTLNLAFPWLKYDFRLIKKLLTMAVMVKKYVITKRYMVDIFEEKAKLHPKKPFLIFQDNVYTYELMEKKMNQVARAGLKMGLKKGDVVGILMENEPAFAWTAYGLIKIGVEPAFLNYNLRSKSLLHCFAVSDSSCLIIGQSNEDELIHAVQDILPDLQKRGVHLYLHGCTTANVPEGFHSFQDLVEACSDGPISKSYRNLVRPRDTFCYIYTSGTTGLPKAAVVSHDKALKGAVLMQGVNVHSNDILYTPLPLYHSAAGLIALGTTIERGATLVLRKKFSATHFWEDCRVNKVTVIQYIGELCRYLLARPESPDDGDHQVRAAVGNGLRLDVWNEYQRRFKIPVICEFYAATEGNAGFINIFNNTGSVGRTSPIMKHIFPTYFISYDIAKDEVVRNRHGLCIEVPVGVPGLLVTQIKRNFEFDGYKGNKELTEKKIIRNVFKKGDAFFNSGDLLTLDKDHFVYFTDRIGDTFRWKGENVSTVEVANVMADPDWIEDANVYGVAVPGQDGRAGMAAITTKNGSLPSQEQLDSLFLHAKELLPAYAIPRFLRFQGELEVTTTFKQRKGELVKEGFDPNNIRDCLFVADFTHRTYSKLDSEMHGLILSGHIRL